MSVRITAARDKCVAGGACTVLCPTVFDLDEDGLVLLLRDEVDGPEVEAAQDAADACPGNAIEVAASGQAS